MQRPTRKPFLQPTALAVAALAACGPAAAQDSTADASVSAGVGLLSGDAADRALFGQYNGLRDKDAVGLLDFEYSRRNPETGTSTSFEGVNLLGEVRALDFRWKHQGDWKFKADYGRLGALRPAGCQHR